MSYNIQETLSRPISEILIDGSKMGKPGLDLFNIHVNFVP